MNRIPKTLNVMFTVEVIRGCFEVTDCNESHQKQHFCTVNTQNNHNITYLPAWKPLSCVNPWLPQVGKIHSWYRSKCSLCRTKPQSGNRCEIWQSWVETSLLLTPPMNPQLLTQTHGSKVWSKHKYVWDRQRQMFLLFKDRNFKIKINKNDVMFHVHIAHSQVILRRKD